MTSLVVPVELAHPAQALLGEGPLWDDSTQRLRWVDILGRSLHDYDPVAGIDSHESFPQPVTTVALSKSRGLLVALADRIVALPAPGAAPIELNHFRADSTKVRFNDGKADPWGGFQVGTMHLDGAEAVGHLYRLSPDYSLEVRLSGLTCSNGLDWSEDGKTFFHVDSVLSKGDTYSTDADTGKMTGRRGFLEVSGPGIPDGLSLDADGCVWVAIWGGGEVRRLTPDGTVDRVVKLPVSRVTSVAFGGEDRDELFITTARDGLSEGELVRERHAGDLFWCRPGTSGRPANRFLGNLREPAEAQNAAAGKKGADAI